MHWLHSLDQMIFTIGSACHTVEELYRVMHELKEDRQFAIASAFAESKRGQSKQALSEIVVADRKETPVNVYKAEANLLENKSRHIIAQPALDAARVELYTINAIIERVGIHVKTAELPLLFHTVQRTENSIAVLWRGFLELVSYGSVSIETNAQLLARGLPLDLGPILTDVQTRDDFYEAIRLLVPYPGEYVTTTFLSELYKESLKTLSVCEHLASYKLHFLAAQRITNDLPRLLPQGGRSLAGANSTER